MQWLGKAVGGILGFAAAGPFGSVLGVLLGHQLDQGLARPSSARKGFDAQQISALYFEVAFEIMGRIAKADGRVSEREIRVARQLMHSMQLTPEQVTAAIRHFTIGKEAGYPLAERLAGLRAKIGSEHGLARAFLELQMRAAIASGSLGKAKRTLLWETARTLGIGRVELAQIEAVVRAAEHGRAAGREDTVSLAEAYRVLGIGSSASDTEVKTAYRRLMNQHHPDKLVARGLPPSMNREAEEKTRQVRSAYERVKAHRADR